MPTAPSTAANALHHVKEARLVEVVQVGHEDTRTNVLCSARSDKCLEIGGGKAILVIRLYRVVGIHYDGNEQRQDHINVQGYERVQVDLAEPPQPGGLAGKRGKGGEHIITVYQRKQALWRCSQRSELHVIGSQDQPAAKHKSSIDQQGGDKEAQNLWCRLFQRQYHNVVGFEEAEVAQHSEPNKQVANSQKKRAGIPLVHHQVPSLDLLF